MKIITFSVGLIAFGMTLSAAGLLTLWSYGLMGVLLSAVIHSAILALDTWLIFALLLGLSALFKPSVRREPLLRSFDEPRLYRAR